MSRSLLASLAVGLLLAGCASRAAQERTPAAVTVAGEQIRIDFNDHLHSRVVVAVNGKELLMGAFSPSEYVIAGGSAIADFSFDGHETAPVEDGVGSGERHQLSGTAGGLRKNVSITLYDDFPSMAVYEVEYVNEGEEEVAVDGWVNHHYAVRSPRAEGDAFWSYQSGSYVSRPDWLLPVNPGFGQDNYMGMNNSDYGGGTPVIDLWHREAGLAVGHLELVPKLVSLPVEMWEGDEATLHIRFDRPITIAPGDSMATFRTFVNAHEGDYFTTLQSYRAMMIAQGVEFPDIHDDAYEPQWCAWGYERDFTMEQVYGTLPKVEELGYHWVVLDDGWQTNVGDWSLHPEKYPRGDADMIAFVDRVREAGFRAKLWWAPMAMHPESNLYESNPDYLLLDESGQPVEISWWNAHYMCPGHAPVQQYTNRLVETIIGRWGYEGLKIDGQHLNAAPPCYNPAHNHAHPEESTEAVPAFFRGIYQTATARVPDALIEICPCGTAYSFHTMPYMTQGVASDPTSSWQVRLKGKTLKALMGTSTPYFGDHVELTSSGEDFASQVGIGAVIGTKFTWPVGAKEGSSAELTPEREQHWARWSGIYERTRLAEGTYRGELYDLGFDRPEAHAIEKEDKMYYAFYADVRGRREFDGLVSYQGPVEIRGLGAGAYLLRDYENDREVATVSGPTATIELSFDGHLLLVAEPIN